MGAILPKIVNFCKSKFALQINLTWIQSFKWFLKGLLAYFLLSLGCITADELKFVMNHLPGKVTYKEIDEMIKTVDENGDGKINYQEFRVMIGAKPNLIGQQRAKAAKNTPGNTPAKSSTGGTTAGATSTTTTATTTTANAISKK